MYYGLREIKNLRMINLEGRGGANGLFSLLGIIDFSSIIFYSKIYSGQLQLHNYAAYVSYPSYNEYARKFETQLRSASKTDTKKFGKF